MIHRPSDTSINQADYANGIGYYTDVARIANLLSVPEFDDSSYPTEGHVGELIRYAEDYIDEYTKDSWRPILIENEYHDFDYDMFRMNRASLYNKYTDYVGYIRLNAENLRKIVRLAVWRGNQWEELAGATSSVTITDHTNITNVVLRLPNSGTTFTLTPGTTVSTFNTTYGNRTAAYELAYLINEQLPVMTNGFTGSSGRKAITSGSDSISDFFYATVEQDNKVVISSTLLGDDGKNCTLTVSGSGVSREDFSDTEARGREQAWWDIRNDGAIFFRTNYPYNQKHSIRVTYLTGGASVPAIITEAATKIVACELMAEDDSTLLLGENGEAGLALADKYTKYKEEIDKILGMKKRLIYFLDSD